MTVTVESHNGTWLVTQNGVTISTHRKKSAAKRRATRTAGNGERIVIQDTSGRIVDSRRSR